jgi:hypothetical protein
LLESHEEKYLIGVKNRTKITSFAPYLFMKLRKKMGLDEKSIIDSLSSIKNRKQIFKSNQRTGQGRSSNQGGQSSSFFFTTEDSKFIVKTISA